MNDNFDLVLKEAHRLLDANPALKFYEALIEAKKVIKIKDPIACQQIGSKENTLLSTYHERG